MAQPNSPEASLKALEARIVMLEKALQVSAGKVVLQCGTAKITLTGNQIELLTQGNVNITAASNVQVVSGVNTNMTSGMNAQITGAANVSLIAGGNVSLKGAKIVQN